MDPHTVDALRALGQAMGAETITICPPAQVPHPLIFGDALSIRVRDIGREAALRNAVYCPVDGCDTCGTDRTFDRYWLNLESFGVAIIRWTCLHCGWQFQTDYDGRFAQYEEFPSP